MASAPEVRYRVAGFWRRALAWACDLFILTATLSVLALVVAAVFGVRLPGFREIGVDFVVEAALGGGPRVGMALVGAVFVSMLYFLWFHAVSGQTVGKRWLGIRVITRYGKPLGFSRAAARLFGYALSLLVLSLGFVWIGFDREKRGLHDWLAGTYVVFT